MDEATDLKAVTNWVSLKRAKNGLYINPARGPWGCLSAAVTVAQYFLKELGLSPNIARRLEGRLNREEMLFETTSSFAVPPNIWVIAIDHIIVFPVDDRPSSWKVVQPDWIYAPINLDEPLKTVVLPIYNIRPSLSREQLPLPLYDAVLLALQTHLYECFRREMQSIAAKYFQVVALPENEEEVVEMQDLVLPAMRALVDLLPCLKGADQGEIRYVTDRATVGAVSGDILFRKNVATSLWSCYYHTNRWQELDPITHTSPSVPHLLFRRDFSAVLMQSVAILLARKFKEIEREIVKAKQ